MIVRKLMDLKGSEREVRGEHWVSRRLLVRDDGMGFSLHDTTIYAGTSTEMRYANHLEAVYCIEGSGQLENLDSGETYPLEPGTMYALNQHDRHVLTAHCQMRMVCVFNPPLVGPEVHDETGAYPASAAESSWSSKA